jgi:hypothetical protein
VKLVAGGNSEYRVIIAKEASSSQHRAAAELKRLVGEMSSAMLRFDLDSPNPPEKSILVGDSKALRSLNLGIDFRSFGDEGYLIRTVGDRLVIAGGRLRGTMYGVYAFLEDVLGCRLAWRASLLPSRTSLRNSTRSWRSASTMGSQTSARERDRMPFTLA